MSTETKNMIVPKLRFAGFKNDGEWKFELLEEVYSFKSTNSFSRDDLNYENGTVKNIHYGDIHTKFSTLFDIGKERVPFINPSIAIDNINQESYCIEGDIIFADASEDLKDVGKSIEVVNLNNEKLLSGMHTILARQKEPKLVVGFGGHLFMTDGIRTQIQRESQGTKVLGISGTRISSVKIYYPKNKIEQQKIAECLSSLDELITAHNQKLEALQSHKKGLMQLLFPAEGESVPKLRFKEFRNGDWEEEGMGKLFKFKQGVQVAVENQYLTKNETMVRFIRIIDITSDAEPPRYIENPGKDHLIQENDLFMIRYGTPGLISIGFKGVIANNLFRLIWNFDEKYVSKFWFYVLQRMEKTIYDLSGSSSMPAISFSTLEGLTIQFPSKPEEQQKIADCLSSIDELIMAQTEKIEELKVHKKGLMQGLFPKTTN